MRVFLVVLLLCAGAAGCARKSEVDTSQRDAEPGRTSSAEIVLDAGGDGARDRGERVQIAATHQVSVCDIPAWPETQGSGAKRLGYLRHGAVVEAYESAVINDECREGWFELTDGSGWVCSKYATVDLASPRVRLAPHQPDRDAGMPYQYGVNLSDGTPLYRRVLNAEDRKKFEPHLVRAKSGEDDGEKSGGGDSTEAAAEKKDDDEAIASTSASSEGEPRIAQAKKPEKGERSERSESPRDAGADGGRDRPKLRELKGRGVLVRKLSRGFYVALDREFKAANTRWWRTSFGFAVPFEKIMVQPPRTKHAGNWFERSPFAEVLEGDADAGANLAGTVAFVRNHASVKLTLSEDGKRMGWGAELPARSAVLLDGRTVTIGGVTYQGTVSGFFVQLATLVVARATPPADLGENEKWIDVDLTRQTLVAFEGKRPVFATLVSSGRRNPQDKEHDFPTPTGTFRIGEKHVTTTMDGDVASDGPYSIEDVPWVMYFQGSYALHGAFWHDNFGHVRSHGCVNLAPEDARTLFHWADPPLPAGWHGAFAQHEDGTRVVIHEDPPPPRRRASAAQVAAPSE